MVVGRLFGWFVPFCQTPTIGIVPGAWTYDPTGLPVVVWGWTVGFRVRTRPSDLLHVSLGEGGRNPTQGVLSGVGTHDH